MRCSKEQYAAGVVEYVSTDWGQVDVSTCPTRVERQCHGQVSMSPSCLLTCRGVAEQNYRECIVLFNLKFQDRLHALRSLDNPGLQSFPQLLQNFGSTIAPGDLIDDPRKDKQYSIGPVIL